MMKRIKRGLAAAGLLLCLAGGTVSAFAAPEDTKTEVTPTLTATPEPTKTPEPTATPTATPEPTNTPEPTEPPAPSSKEEYSTVPLPSGNLTLAEDVISVENGNREFLTVYSREGDFFYIIIDRDAEGTGNVYFLNMVDDRDLYSLSGDAMPDRTTDNAASGNIRTTETAEEKVQVQESNEASIMTPEDTEETAEQQKPRLNLPVLIGGATALILLILIYFLKVRKKENKGPEYNIEEFLTDEGENDDDNKDTA